MRDVARRIRAALERYDADPALAREARRVRGFDGALVWMARRAGREPSGDGGRLGWLKYALCSAAGIAAALVMHPLGVIVATTSAALAFYAVEARLAFVFPLAALGEPHPWRGSIAMVGALGGTFAVMRLVVPLAAFMLLGGWLGRGFVRSWCAGCLVVLDVCLEQRCAA